MSVFSEDRTFQQPFNWTTTGFMIAFHLCAIAALFMLTWTGVALAVLLYCMAGCLGIGMGYHRLLTHRGYKTPIWMEYFLTLCGTFALEGGPISWVATHRIHHQNTDQRRRPTFTAGWRHLGSHGLDHHRQSHASEHRRAFALRPRPAQTQISHVDHHVPLGAQRSSRGHYRVRLRLASR